MAGVDLETFRFDYDLTFSALLMNADGTIYHTFGGRTWESADKYLFEPAFIRVLEQTTVEHAAYQKAPKPPTKHPIRTIEDLPAARKRLEAGQKADCYHCHTVHDFMTEGARDAKRFRMEDVFRWPDPIQIGLTLDPEDQALIVSVEPDSPAAGIGLRAGDRLLFINEQSILTFGDVQRALHNELPKKTTVAVRWQRDDSPMLANMLLGSEWKVPTPLAFSWRPSKWPLTPKPGFGGPRLTRAELEAEGLSRDAFAFRINYFVTWGPTAHVGRNATEAGLREGDVVYSLDGKDDFESVDHFHSWFRLTRKVGQEVKVAVVREGSRLTVKLPVIE